MFAMTVLSIIAEHKKRMKNMEELTLKGEIHVLNENIRGVRHELHELTLKVNENWKYCYDNIDPLVKKVHKISKDFDNKSLANIIVLEFELRKFMGKFKEFEKLTNMSKFRKIVKATERLQKEFEHKSAKLLNKIMSEGEGRE
jgi:hypothetical protein